MMRGMYSAISGLKTHQIMLDVTANDLANVNTVGFKSSRMTFRDSLTQLQRAAAGTNLGSGGNNPAQIGLGVQLGSIDNLMGAGAFQSTGNTLDVAIQGEGWFRVGAGVPTAGAPQTNPPADPLYTRAGNFTRSEDGYLMTQDGFYVVGRTDAGGGGADCYLFIPPGATDLAMAPDGAVSFVPPAGYTHPSPPLPPLAGGRAIAGYLSLAKFANENGLERVSGNRWSSNASTGAETVNTPGGADGAYGQTIGGVLEMSNVDLAAQFTQMITAQRGFQASSRVISASDEMLQDLVNLKR